MATPKTEPESPDEFDFGAWLTGASAPEREVTVYAANAVRADIARLEQERADAKARASAGGSWGDPGGTDLDSIEKRLAEARRKLAASGLVFRVRSLDSEDGDRIRRQYPEKKGATDDEQVDVYNARFLVQMAAQIFHPKKFTVSELKQLRAAVSKRTELLRKAKIEADGKADLPEGRFHNPQLLAGCKNAAFLYAQSARQ